VAGGGFTIMDGAPAARVVSWNGDSWSTLGSGFDQSVFALQSFNDTLYAAGAFQRSGNQVVHHVARWDGTAWRPVGEGFDSWVTDLEVYQGRLVACGFFNRSGTEVVSRVAAWTGGKWESLGATMRVYESVRAMTVFDGRLVATGNFHVLGSVNATNIAAWNGSSWGVISSGFVVSSGQAVAGVGTRLFVAGGTVYPEGFRICRIHQWNGTQWSEPASGPTGGAKHVTALAEFQGSLYVGGTFERLGSEAASHFLARYDGLGSMVPVRLASFAAERVDAGVAVRWEIAGDVADLAGFHLHREDGNSLVRLTTSRLSGQRKYEYLDVDAPSGTLQYRLEAVLRSGEREWFGPIRAADPAGTPAPPLRLSGAPNPFSDRTTIALSLPAAGPVRLEAFDAAGRVVAIVHEGVLSEGGHELSWDGCATDGARLPSGIYFLRLMSRQGSVSRKVVLTR